MPQLPEDIHPTIIATSVGGSLLRPRRLNVGFSTRLVEFECRHKNDAIFFNVTGGGGYAREAEQDLIAAGVTDPESLDEAGILVTQLNAHSLYVQFQDCDLQPFHYERADILHRGTIFQFGDPQKGSVYFTGGLKEGNTTDTITAQVVEEALTLPNFSPTDVLFVNLSNTRGIHPKYKGDINYHQVIKSISWDEYIADTPDFYSGIHVPIEKTAAQMLAKLGAFGVAIGGRNIDSLFDNFERVLTGGKFVGTILHP